jgi:hypothetical protein
MAKRRTRRQIQRACYTIIAGLLLFAWFSPYARAWVLAMLAWVAYEVLVCPTRCGVQNKSDGLPCANPVLGRLNACHVGDHSRKKLIALLRVRGAGHSRSTRGVLTPPSPSQSPGRATPDFIDEPAIEPHQRAMFYLTVIGTIGTIIQAVTGLAP